MNQKINDLTDYIDELMLSLGKQLSRTKKQEKRKNVANTMRYISRINKKIKILRL